MTKHKRPRRAQPNSATGPVYKATSGTSGGGGTLAVVIAVGLLALPVAAILGATGYLLHGYGVI